MQERALFCDARRSRLEIHEMMRVAEVAAVGQGAVASYTDSKGRCLEWRGVSLATALACSRFGKKGTGTGSGTGGHEFPFEHV